MKWGLTLFGKGWIHLIITRQYLIIPIFREDYIKMNLDSILMADSGYANTTHVITPLLIVHTEIVKLYNEAGIYFKYFIAIISSTISICQLLWIKLIKILIFSSTYKKVQRKISCPKFWSSIKIRNYFKCHCCLCSFT